MLCSSKNMPRLPGNFSENGMAAPVYFGQIVITKSDAGFTVCHRDDQARDDLPTFRGAEAAVDIAKFDDAGNYRALKTAPNLRRGWRLQLGQWEELTRALDYFYPGRLAVFAAWKRGKLPTTSLRETLDRQSGMYRVAAKISDEQINDVVADFCRSDGGCLRTILWKRDSSGTLASTKLPNEKYDPHFDQARAAAAPGCLGKTSQHPMAAFLPLLCQEPCNLLVAACRRAVKGERVPQL
jgi:hypothetical protein